MGHFIFILQIFKPNRQVKTKAFENFTTTCFGPDDATSLG